MNIPISGIEKFTTIDYPDKLSAVVFLQGCAWRCFYCHNPHLLPYKAKATISVKKLFDFLATRKGLLDAVVISGGDPLLHKDLGMFLKKIQQMGFLTGLHTAGIYPNRLKKVLPFLNWVGLDIKAKIEDYKKITKVKNSGEKAWQSLQIVLDSDINYQLRTTLDKNETPKEYIEELGLQLNQHGCQNLEKVWKIQKMNHP